MSTFFGGPMFFFRFVAEFELVEDLSERVLKVLATWVGPVVSPESMAPDVDTNPEFLCRKMVSFPLREHLPPFLPLFEF